MADALRGWQPDPYGAHALRFFADDGKPTLLVRDGEITSYDPPPSPSDQAFIRKPDSAVPPPPDRVPARAPAPIPTPTKLAEAVAGSNPTPHPGTALNDRHQTPPPPPESSRPLPPPMAKPAKAAYAIVLAAMVASAIVLVFIHLGGGGHGHQALSATTTTKASPTTTSTDPPTTQALPAEPKPTAALAAADLISSWAAGNQAEALSVATTAAVSTLFAGHYVSGLVIDRGCSVAFSPIVCSYGPPGGADPTDPIYELYVVQSAGGWYVSSAKINN
jgi:hypothetical protein